MCVDVHLSGLNVVEMVSEGGCQHAVHGIEGSHLERLVKEKSTFPSVAVVQ